MKGGNHPEQSHLLTVPALHLALCGPRQGEETRKKPSIQPGRGPWKDPLSSVSGAVATSQP